jgi:hypothetical protein
MYSLTHKPKTEKAASSSAAGHLRKLGTGTGAAPTSHLNLQKEAEGPHPSGRWNGALLRDSFQRGWAVHGGASRIQAKLAVNQPGDASELEADTVASQVMLMPESQAGCPGSAKASSVARAQSAAVDMQTAPPQVQQVLSRPGKPLDNQTRQFMEPRFGWDFSRIRVHSNEEAAQSAESIGARAYAVGENIAFAHGQYQPETHSGRLLLAHELTHTVQRSGGIRRQQQAVVTDPPATLEGLVNDSKTEVEATWRAANIHGVQVYFDSQMLKRIEDLEKKQHEDSWKEFFFKMAEFAIAFIPGGEEAEGVIEGVKRAAELTTKYADYLMHVPEHMEKHPDLESLRNNFDHAIIQGADAIVKDLNSTAAGILQGHLGISHNEALGRLLRHYFKDKPVEVIGGLEGMIDDNPPRLKYEVITKRMEHCIRWAALLAEEDLPKRLEEVEPGSSLEGNTRSEIAFVQAPDGNIRLALLKTDYSLYRALPSDPGARGQPKFVDWVPTGNVSDALNLQGTKGGPRNYSWDEVKLFMLPWRPPELVEWLREHGAPI